MNSLGASADREPDPYRNRDHGSLRDPHVVRRPGQHRARRSGERRHDVVSHALGRRVDRAPETGQPAYPALTDARQRARTAYSTPSRTSHIVIGKDEQVDMATLRCSIGVRAAMTACAAVSAPPSHHPPCRYASTRALDYAGACPSRLDQLILVDVTNVTFRPVDVVDISARKLNLIVLRLAHRVSRG